MKRQQMLFIDFDETLFQHNKFQEWFSGYITKKYLVDTAKYLKTFGKYNYVKDVKGLLRLYKHKEHLLNETGLSWQLLSGEIQEAVSEQGLDFCYSDAHKFLTDAQNSGIEKVRLLTYGDPDFQRFKISLCRIARDLPVHIVGEPKAEFLNKEFGGASVYGVLLDDKAPLNLPKNWQHLWLNRYSGTPPEDTRLIEINELDFQDTLRRTLLDATIN